MSDLPPPLIAQGHCADNCSPITTRTPITRTDAPSGLEFVVMVDHFYSVVATSPEGMRDACAAIVCDECGSPLLWEQLQ